MFGLLVVLAIDFRQFLGTQGKAARKVVKLLLRTLGLDFLEFGLLPHGLQELILKIDHLVIYLGFQPGQFHRRRRSRTRRRVPRQALFLLLPILDLYLVALLARLGQDAPLLLAATGQLGQGLPRLEEGNPDSVAWGQGPGRRAGGGCSWPGGRSFHDNSQFQCQPSPQHPRGCPHP